ncbi:MULTISPECIES: Tol-Pal system beta propeller repeat protein TolB [Silvimonas]|uniref:Tol-Pal system beta propeller repeat protein TolB n=1 Tax=Silvimonas TaxID=300264 RepID=UPI0024B386C0|nr:MULTISPECIES: Tol-Pal system beta propeller repeat protein TolB [Silvimonas]MDR3429786.1 Tol-Pal system beta propeller repeat protein TolB [Silvimonas sp.]
MLLRFARFVLAMSLLASAAARADISFDVVGVGANQYPIAIAPFQNEVQQQQPVTTVVSDDLTRSGLFKVIGAGDLSPVPYQPSQINFGAVAAKGAQTVLIGNVSPSSNGQVSVKFWLMDAASKQQLVGYELIVPPTKMRYAAHKISDMIYQKITGFGGMFTSRIAYITKQGKRFELQVADADGFGSQAILASNQPIMSPKWSPDGTRLAYVSFEDQKPVVYIQDLLSGKRWKASNFKGSNSAPAWSPDGSKLAVVLTRTGGSQIYLVDASGPNSNSSNARQLTNTGDINTEPSFTADGQIIFTSDRGGSPQIYRMSGNGGAAERLTFQGSYNASGKVSADGKSLVFVTQSGGYKVAIMDMSTRQVQVLTDSSRDDSPTFAPNGRMVLYETQAGGKGVLAAVSSDGRVKARLRAQAGDVRQPAWGPMLK